MWRRGKGRERSRKFGLTEYKRDKTKRQKSGKNGNKESVPQQIWRDIPNILCQVRRWNFVARTAHDGKINSTHFIVSAQKSTDCLSLCCFQLIQSKLQINIKKITTINHADLSKFMSSAFMIKKTPTARQQL